MLNSKMERLEIVLEIINKLKNFKSKNNTIINLYDENLCSFIKELKEIFKEYINQDDKSVDNIKDFKGNLNFEEIDKKIEYFLPCKKNKKSLFVIRGE